MHLAISMGIEFVEQRGDYNKKAAGTPAILPAKRFTSRMAGVNHRRRRSPVRSDDELTTDISQQFPISEW